MPSTISAGTTAGTAIAITGDTTGNLAFQTNGTTTAMTIDTSQNVGVGTASPGQRLEVLKSGGGAIRISETASRYVEINGYAEGSANGSVMAFSTITAGTSTLAERGRFDNAGNFLFNSGYGSVATAYGCRAWVNFDGTTSPGTIRGSGNVSSVSRTGTGAYTVNFTTSMPDTNYAVVGTTNQDSRTVSIGNLLAGSAAMRTTNSAGALENQTLVAIAVFR